jgi:vesicle transport through interaction with t-SNAREs protein 1
MSNLIDADAGTERFGGYEAELKLVQADLSQQIEQIKETTGEPRKAAISRAERALEEAEELVSRSLNAPNMAHSHCNYPPCHYTHMNTC